MKRFYTDAPVLLDHSYTLHSPWKDGETLAQRASTRQQTIEARYSYPHGLDDGLDVKSHLTSDSPPCEL